MKDCKGLRSNSVSCLFQLVVRVLDKSFNFCEKKRLTLKSRVALPDNFIFLQKTDFHWHIPKLVDDFLPFVFLL